MNKTTMNILKGVTKLVINFQGKINFNLKTLKFPVLYQALKEQYVQDIWFVNNATYSPS